MIAVTIHAFVLIGVVVFTGFILRKYGSKPSSIMQVVLGIIIPSFVLFLGLMFTVHACQSGTPFTQLLIPCICLALIIFFINDEKVLNWTVFIIVLLAIFLNIQFLNIVHSSYYTANPDFVDSIHERFTKHNLQLLEDNLKEIAETDETSYPAGWLKNLEIKEFLLPNDKYLLEDHIIIKSYNLWHSYITGLYGAKKIGRQLIWYPGGMLKDNLDKFVYKKKLDK